MTKVESWDWVTLGDEEGRVDRPAAVPTWSTAPEIELDGSWLLFRYPIRTLRPGRRGEAAATLLTEFVKLDEAPAERILDYARRHGRFGFCKHGDPSHRLRPEGCAADVAPPLPVKPLCVRRFSGGAILQATPAHCSTRRPSSPRAGSMT